MKTKQLLALAAGCLLSLNLVLAGQTTGDADQKWLAAVGKMVANGQTTVSTPVESRTRLLQDWAKTHGYSVTIVKTESTYRAEISKNLAKN